MARGGYLHRRLRTVDGPANRAPDKQISHHARCAPARRAEDRETPSQFLWQPVSLPRLLTSASAAALQSAIAQDANP